ncbi:MAG: hypothetical protein Q8L09_00420 [Candidatus Moranbacteria bacterium]|nr:hypothetical protein [Candidatus Moranbacteria bacterium]
MKNIKKITKKKSEKAEDKLPEKKRCKKILPVLIGFFVGFLLNFVIISVYFFWMAKYSESPAKKMSSEKSINLPPSAPAPIPPPALVPADPTAVPKIVSSGATYAFSGTVVGVERNTITVDMFSCGEGHKTYKMLVTKNTVIIKREKEQENPASLDDIKENYNVAVEAFEDIKSKDNFEAKKIMIMSQNNLNLSN